MNKKTKYREHVEEIRCRDEREEGKQSEKKTTEGDRRRLESGLALQ